MIAKLVAAALLYWLLKPGDDEPAAPTGAVDIGDDWTANFNATNGQWSDAYRHKDPGDIP